MIEIRDSSVKKKKKQKIREAVYQAACYQIRDSLNRKPLPWESSQKV